MLFWTIVRVALQSLFANKLRSVLAMLGMIIGVGAVIAMLALGAGAQRQVLARIRSMGSNLLVIQPGQVGTGGVMSGTRQDLTPGDAMAVLRQVPAVAAVTPAVGGSAQLKYYRKNTRTSVTGSASTWFDIRNFPIAQGHRFTDFQVNGMARVVVLGPVTAKNLFGDQSAVGHNIKLNGIIFRVIGVMKAKGDQGWFNPDDQAVIPYTTAMTEVFGQGFLREIDVEAAPGSNLNKVQAQCRSVLRRRHHLYSGKKDDFFIRNQAAILKTASSFMLTFTILLGGIAGISLLVGGIGIMNIMLVTVTERTREIGVRKAIGAKNRDILRQFLLEAVLMSGVGGLLGVVAGVGLAKIVRFHKFVPHVTNFSILLSLGFSALIGIFFGFYPAWRAALLDPIEALRYE